MGKKSLQAIRWFFSSDGHRATWRGQDNQDPISCYLTRQAYHSVWIVQSTVTAGFSDSSLCEKVDWKNKFRSSIIPLKCPSEQVCSRILNGSCSTFLQRFLENIAQAGVLKEMDMSENQRAPCISRCSEKRSYGASLWASNCRSQCCKML